MNFEEFSEVFLLLSEFEKLKFQILRNELEKYKIHPGQVPLFFIINQTPGITQNEIAEKIHVSPSTVAIMLRRMERHGLITRKTNEKDRRELKVFLTEKSQKLVDKLFRKMKHFESLSLKGFTDEEINCFTNLLKKILKNLEAMKND
ncbi:MAG: MarR family transcriptional regulator [Thermosipho sp. (in: Bacteria)]|nr:MarR family transcriptional regulator [Thermosipho sp. (in: thermotogales)]